MDPLKHTYSTVRKGVSLIVSLLLTVHFLGIQHTTGISSMHELPSSVPHTNPSHNDEISPSGISLLQTDYHCFWEQDVQQDRSGKICHPFGEKPISPVDLRPDNESVGEDERKRHPSLNTLSAKSVFKSIKEKNRCNPVFGFSMLKKLALQHLATVVLLN